MDNLELLNKLDTFYIYSNQGLYIENIFEKEKYIMTYSSKIDDIYSNYVINLKAKSKEEFDIINKEVKTKMEKLDRNVCYIVTPFDGHLYENRKNIFENNAFKEAENEVWQIFDDLDKIDEIYTNCNLNITLERTKDMGKFAKLNDECFSTDDIDDPYGSLNSGYINAYKSYLEEENKYKKEFYFIKLDNELIGVTVSVYGKDICGLCGLAIKKEYRRKGIGKEVLKKQLQICKDKNKKFAFLQTEEGFYPAKLYRKIGFKDVCNVYYYTLK